MDEPAQWRLSDSGEELDGFHGLQTANDSREHAQDTGFGSRWDRSLGRRFGEKAAVAGPAEVGGEDGDLALELEDGTVDEGLFEEEGGVVGGEAGGEIVGAIENGVVRSEKVEAVFGLKAAGEENDFHVGIDLPDPFSGALKFGGSDAIGVVENLSVKV